ncbi:Probable multidrug resistance ABC transporter ATP-binding/permease protein YheH [Actinomyces bovis]|uniref:Probable multidrug resistance ABC transporter ATP-binding/permease protein YheH n=1 Tax=Actinomyces bovis TaxID=1658 RepID=A0ABY1VK47_9ACTO|nr:ABC transporter ATP-binding protein [Actinomyces bovis]SPT52466.1 Probable multidrug resistance ABC transporter ATP-binding/permease protein YheH [Actinomyces bovis]VEG54144.1 Probable multidrug resistance ABC transporter ATP-binding/permease protein YheH [Actinomyces israelii]
MSHGPGPRHDNPNEKAKDFKGTWRRLLKELAPERVRITVVVALTVISVVLSVLAPKVLARATNIIFSGVISNRLAAMGAPRGTSGAELTRLLEAAGQGEYASMVSAYDIVVGRGMDTPALLTVLAQVLALYGVSAVFLWIQGRILAGVIQRTGKRLRAEVEDKLTRVPLSYIDQGSRGDMLSRVTNDVDNVTQTLQQTLSQAVNAVITVVGVLAMMLTVSIGLSLVSLATVPVAFIVTVLIAKRAQPHFTEQWAATGDVGGVVEEAFSGHEVVTLFSSEKQFAQLFDQDNQRLYEGSYQAQWISGTIQPAMRVVSNLNFVVIAVFGGLRITQGAMTLGDVQAFIQYSQQFTQPITQLASMASLLQSGAASAERLFEVMDAPEEELPSSTEQLAPRVAGRIVFDHVRFSYSPETELIKDLNLVVEPGQTVAIVGPTGAGKTTLVNLLLRFYDPQEGRILIDGVDTRRVSRDELRRQIGMVLQDTWLFEGSIAENIAFGAPGAGSEQVLAAAKAASVDHVVSALPKGYETVIDDSGAGVSAGEKQLITIARAFLADRQILVLDEATSSVDTRTELLVQQAMVGLRHGRTSFVIAHRLSTIRDADVILVMEDGDIVEQGSHEQLIAKRGAYWELYQSQFNGPADEAEPAASDSGLALTQGKRSSASRRQS